jgi:pimeloyl-ACP methyl ester carboxylesterase
VDDAGVVRAARLVCEALATAVLRAHARRGVTAGPAGTAARLQDSELEAFRQGSRGGAHEALLAYRDWDVDLARIRVPTHIWLGTDDIFVSQQMGRHLHRTIPGVDFHWVDQAGHFAVSTWDDILTACATHVER